MTTERKPIMDEDLARIELDLSALDPDAAEYHWIAAAHVRRLLKALPALVAEVRELRQALVLALREAPDMAGCCEDCDAVMERRRAALAPFAHLGGEP